MAFEICEAYDKRRILFQQKIFLTRNGNRKETAKLPRVTGLRSNGFQSGGVARLDDKPDSVELKLLGKTNDLRIEIPPNIMLGQDPDYLLAGKRSRLGLLLNGNENSTPFRHRDQSLRVENFESPKECGSSYTQLLTPSASRWQRNGIVSVENSFA